MRGGAWWLLVAAAAIGAGKRGSGAGPWHPVPAVPARTDVAARPGWLSFDELVALARGAGWTPQDALLAARIAWAESRGNPRAVRDIPPAQAKVLKQLPERSIGLWQVNVLDQQGNLRRGDEGQLYDPAYNAAEAYKLWRAAGFRPWPYPGAW